MDRPDPHDKPILRRHTFPPRDKIERLKANASEWQNSLRRVKSEIEPRARWFKRAASENDQKRSIGAAVHSANNVAHAVPLSGSLFHGPESLDHSLTHSRWVHIIATSNSTDEASILEMADGSPQTATFELAENDSSILLSPPASTTPSRLLSRIPNPPAPIAVPDVDEYAHIQPINPDHTQLLDPGSTPSGSPVALFPGSEAYRRSTLYDVQEPILDDIFAAVSNLDALICQVLPTGRQFTQDSQSSYKTADQWCERKMLIIGSDYDKDTMQASTRFSTASSLNALYATHHDVKSLASVFRNRGYSVNTITQRQLRDRTELVEEIARFLRPALRGDVRALVFTGHAIKHHDSVCMVLPGVSSDIIISAHDWNQAIRANTKAGVVVLSILASCYSGAFADQAVRVTNFTGSQEIGNVAALDAPVFITFSSCQSDEMSFESSYNERDQRPRDHFLLALATVARDPRVQTWSDFMTMLQQYFDYVRAMGSNFTEEGPWEWLYNHQQHPMIAATPGRLPAMGIIFPTKSDTVMAGA